MATPTQIAVFDVADHDGATPTTGQITVRILNIGTGVNGIYALAGSDVAPGALVVPLTPEPVLVTGPVLTVENVGEEPVITVEGDGDLSITIGNGIYAGTYTTRHDGAPLTTAMVEAAPTCLLKPVISGMTADGETLTAKPGLWLYDGPDPGDQTWLWQNDTDGALGITDLSYVLKTSDVGATISIDETFSGVTVSSVSTDTIATAMTPPLTVTGLQLWLDADDAATITDFSGDVSQWEDKSGNNRDMVQTISVNRPRTGVNAMNGKNVLTFNQATLDHLRNTTTGLGFSGNPAMTAFIVAHRASGESGNLLNFGDAPPSNQNEILKLSISSGFNAVTAYNDGNIFFDATVPDDPTLLVFRKASGATYAGVESYLNGGSALPELSSVNSTATLSLIDTETWIGAQSNNGNPSGAFGGDIAEILVYDSELSTSNMNTLGNYLATKWGISWTDI